MGDARDAIRMLYAKWFGAMARGDVDGVIALATPDVVLKGPASPAVEGAVALRQALERFHAQFSESVTHSLDEVEVAGDWAWARVREETTLTPAGGGDALTVSGMHLAILRRGSDGAWRVARDVSSLDRAVPGG